MASIREIWDTIRSRDTVVPRFARIDDAQVLGPGMSIPSLVPQEHYFGILIDEIFLSRSREWWREYEPLVLSITEFTYGSTKAVLPFLVGRRTLGEHAQLAPQDMIYRRIGATGIHPFRGGKVTSTVVLCKSLTADWARKLVATIESVSQAVPFAGGMAKFTRLADSVLEGIDSLFSVAQTTPLVGLRQEFDHDLGTPVRPGFFVLIDGPEASYAPETLWVKGDSLYRGTNEAALKPFREASFVLFSIRGTAQVSDLSQLSAHQTAEAIKKLAAGTEEDWRRAKAELVVLIRELITSPDLTAAQADAYYEEVIKAAKRFRKRAKQIGHLGVEDQRDVTDRLRAATALLDLP